MDNNKVSHEDPEAVTNMIEFLMLKNERSSCTGNSRHINIRYFFVKNRLDKKELRVEYCPSLVMLTSFLLNHYRVSSFRSSEM